MTAIDSKTATRFDVEYDVMQASNSMGEGGDFLQRDGKRYHFQNGSVVAGFGFDFSAGLIRKVDTVTALPCFNWKWPFYTEMTGELGGIQIKAKAPEQGYLEVWFDGRDPFTIPAITLPDGRIYPKEGMFALEHRIIDYLD